jgi:hypothetical protein
VVSCRYRPECYNRFSFVSATLESSVNNAKHRATIHSPPAIVGLLFWLTVLVLIAVHVRLARPDSRTLNQECSDEVSRSGVRLIIWRPDPSKNPLTVCMRHCRRQNVQDSPCRTALKHALYSVGLIAREFEDTKIK